MFLEQDCERSSRTLLHSRHPAGCILPVLTSWLAVGVISTTAIFKRLLHLHGLYLSLKCFTSLNFPALYLSMESNTYVLYKVGVSFLFPPFPWYMSSWMFFNRSMPCRRAVTWAIAYRDQLVMRVCYYFPGSCHTSPVLTHLFFCWTSSHRPVQVRHPAIRHWLFILIAHLASFLARLLPGEDCSPWFSLPKGNAYLLWCKPLPREDCSPWLLLIPRLEWTNFSVLNLFFSGTQFFLSLVLFLAQEGGEDPLQLLVLRRFTPHFLSMSSELFLKNVNCQLGCWPWLIGVVIFASRAQSLYFKHIDLQKATRLFLTK